MTIEHLAILPLILVSAGSIITMLAAAAVRNHGVTLALTLATLVASLISMAAAAVPLPSRVTLLLIVDGYARFFSAIILLAAIVVSLLSYDYLKGRREHPSEYYLLLLIATLGGIILVASSHFASFFLGLEILSISLYALIAYERRAWMVEAGLKYLILAAASAAFLLFGMALLYAQLGTMEFSEIASKLSSTRDLISIAGMIMILVGVGFKLSFVPFHMWTPDVYQGAPAPITAFIATVSKGAVFALMLRYFSNVELQPGQTLFFVFTIIAIITMFAGNLLALFQANIKRLLAYSSIAHMGYILVAFLSSGELRVSAVVFYFVTYFVTTLGVFGIIAVLSGKEKDAEEVEQYRGLFAASPWLTVILTAMLLSLAGMPLTAGFVGKFYLVAAGVSSALWALVIILLVNSALGLYYYLRVISVLYAAAPAVATAAPRRQQLAGSIALAALFLALIGLGVYPGPLLEALQAITLYVS